MSGDYTCAIKTTTLLLTSLIHDFRYVLQFNEQTPLSLLRAVLVGSPNLTLRQNYFTLCSIHFPFDTLSITSLKSLHRLLKLQHCRKQQHLFKETITRVYTIEFSHFSLDAHIDSILRRDLLAATIINYIPLHLGDTRLFVLALREECAEKQSLVRYMDVLLN